MHVVRIDAHRSFQPQPATLVRARRRSARIGLAEALFWAAVMIASCFLYGVVTAAPLLAQTGMQEARAMVTEEEPAEAVAAVPDYQDSDFKFQSTYVWQRKPAFNAQYSGENSLSPDREPRSYTLTATAFAGLRPWQGGELYVNPEIVSSQELSELHGLGGFTNGEDQKGGGPDPKLYVARLFLRQTWNLGGGREQLDSAENQLAGAVDKDRMVLTVGRLSVIDLFDNNAYSHDPRTQFLNWTLMTHGAFDYAADTRGYSWGAAIEYFSGDWAFRAGRFEQPIESNGPVLDSRIFAHYGDQAEIEHAHTLDGQAGKLRLLVFRNRARMGGFQDALDAWRAAGSVGVPDVAQVREERSKVGLGISLEQALNDDVGLFARASGNDGQTETYAFTEVERSVSGGLAIKGASWGRPADTVGFGMVRNGLSASHQAYLAAGGTGAFIGDGVPPPGMSFNYAPERIVETYYNASLGNGIGAALDFQHIWNPAYNSGRGPVNVFGLRVHFEY